MEILWVSCQTRIGLAGWLTWLQRKRNAYLELKAATVA